MFLENACNKSTNFALSQRIYVKLKTSSNIMGVVGKDPRTMNYAGIGIPYDIGELTFKF